jgi:hypothetical protein
LSTRPDYKSTGFNESGELLPDGHEKMQALADNYKPGRRAVAGESVKSKAKAFDNLTSKYGPLEDIEAKLRKLEEAGL